MSGKPIAEQDIGYALLNEMVSYAETSISRRKFHFIILERNLIQKKIQEETWMIMSGFQKIKLKLKRI